MHNVFTVVSSFRHTPEIERALQKAMAEKRVSKAHIIYACLTGSENLNRYLNAFDESDIKWCYDERMKTCRNRNVKAATLEAMEAHERIDAELAEKIAANQ